MRKLFLAMIVAGSLGVYGLAQDPAASQPQSQPQPETSQPPTATQSPTDASQTSQPQANQPQTDQSQTSQTGQPANRPAAPDVTSTTSRPSSGLPIAPAFERGH